MVKEVSGLSMGVMALVIATILAPNGVAQEKRPAAGTQNRAAQNGAPKAGTLIRIPLRANACGTGSGAQSIASASVAGEPVHVRTSGDSSFVLAGIPIDSTNGVAFTVRCKSGDSTVTRIATQKSTYPLERLRVAPKFSATPDSALAARMQREAEMAAAVSRNAHNTPRLWTSAFLVPRATRITSGFGGGRTFNDSVTSRHMGTDYAGAVGAPIRAANRGIVRIVAPFYLGGNVVYIDHGEGLVTAYLHMSKQLVSVGDTVQRGDTIGLVGATGRVTGPHLHFIARYGAITVDPASLFALKP
jgi:murein DD-endopeptidase MepM/ murein hydrolase activator NlpD